MATQISPGVVINEIDKSDSLTQVALNAGAIAGPFAWGPIEDVTTVSSETQLVKSFGKPNNDTAINFFTAANFLSYTSPLRVVRAANTSALNASQNGVSGILIKNSANFESVEESNRATANLVFAAKYAGELGNSLRIEVCSKATTYQLTNAAVAVAGSGYANGNVIEITGGTGVVIAKFNVTTNATGNVVSLTSNTVGDYTVLPGLSNTATSNVTGTGVGLRVNLTSALLDGFGAWAYKKNFSSAPGTSEYAEQRNSANDEIHVLVIDNTGIISGKANTILEKYQGLSKASDAIGPDNDNIYFKDVINRRSAWVWVLNPNGFPYGDTANAWGTPANTTPYETLDNVTIQLGHGAAGEQDVDYDTAYTKLTQEGVDFAFIMGADAPATRANAILSDVLGIQKSPMTRPYAMAFFSPEKSDVVGVVDPTEDVKEYRNDLTSTSYAVMDSGWKYQYDTYNKIYRWIPLNGDTAGLVARTEQTSEAWFSPAGFTRGQVKIGNTIKLAWNPNQDQRDDLYNNGINPVVAFPGEGTVLFGDKTLQSKPSAFDRINVRRLLIVLEKTIERSAKFQLFEQNDDFTRSTFVNLVEPFLRSVKGRRGITDFFVVCDETNNPPDVVDRGEFRADIYIKPVRSINFIQINFVTLRSDASFNESIVNLS